MNYNSIQKTNHSKTSHKCVGKHTPNGICAKESGESGTHTGKRNKDLMKLIEHPQLCSRGRNKLPVSPNQFCIHVFMLCQQWLKARAVKRVLPSTARDTGFSQLTRTSQHTRKLRHGSLMPSPFEFRAQLALPELRYQMTNYCIIPLTCTGIHSLKRIQETSQMRAPRSGKNNNPRKQKKDVTVAEFIAGEEAYQNNDRKSSPNNVQKSCWTNTTAIIVLKSRKDR